MRQWSSLGRITCPLGLLINLNEYAHKNPLINLNIYLLISEK